MLNQLNLFLKRLRLKNKCYHIGNLCFNLYIILLEVLDSRGGLMGYYVVLWPLLFEVLMISLM